MIPIPDQFKDKKLLLSIGSIGSLVALSFFLGVMYKGQQDANAQVIQNKNDITEQVAIIKADLEKYVDMEVGGLRADWNRDRLSQEKQINRLESKHFK